MHRFFGSCDESNDVSESRRKKGVGSRVRTRDGWRGRAPAINPGLLRSVGVYESAGYRFRVNNGIAHSPDTFGESSNGTGLKADSRSSVAVHCFYAFLRNHSLSFEPTRYTGYLVNRFYDSIGSHFDTLNVVSRRDWNDSKNNRSKVLYPSSDRNNYENYKSNCLKVL